MADKSCYICLDNREKVMLGDSMVDNLRKEKMKFENTFGEKVEYDIYVCLKCIRMEKVHETDEEPMDEDK